MVLDQLKEQFENSTIKFPDKEQVFDKMLEVGAFIENTYADLLAGRDCKERLEKLDELEKVINKR